LGGPYLWPRLPWRLNVFQDPSALLPRPATLLGSRLGQCFVEGERVLDGCRGWWIDEGDALQDVAVFAALPLPGLLDKNVAAKK